MSAAHTPGPWAQHPEYHWIIKQDASAIGCDVRDGLTIANTCAHEGSGFFPSPTEGRENTRRIVAAVNACEGISTERLEDLGRPLMAHLIGCDERAARQVQTERELLAALKLLDEAFCADDYGTREGRDKGRAALVAARAAIAKAEGAKP